MARALKSNPNERCFGKESYMNRTKKIFTTFLVAAVACGGESESSSTSGIPDEPTSETEAIRERSCRALSPEACVLESACYVTEAWRFNEQGQCWGSRLPAGCAARQLPGDALVGVRAPDGQCWLFGAPPPLDFVFDRACTANALFCEG
jgi:hypothetical protein